MWGDAHAASNNRTLLMEFFVLISLLYYRASCSECQAFYLAQLSMNTSIPLNLAPLNPAPFNRQQIAQALATAPIGHTIDYHERVESTMTLAHQRAADPAVRSGTLIVAEEQSAGRGRQQRRWETPPGQALLSSLILKAPLPLPLSQLPMAAGLAALSAITASIPALQTQVGLKWPNDLLLGHEMADAGKVGGILVETSFYGSTLHYVIIGTGINVLQEATSLPPVPPGAPAPTSMLSYLSKTVAPSVAAVPPLPATVMPDRTALLIAFCHAWAQLLWPQPASDWPSAGTLVPSIVDRWRSYLWTLGQGVVIYGTPGADMVPNLLCQGVAVDVTADGYLLVRDAAGVTHQFAAGDVSVRRRQQIDG